MMRLIIGSVFLCQALMAVEAIAAPDEACNGRWSIELVKDKNYTSRQAERQSLTYPVSLKLDSYSPRRVTFTENRGRDCHGGYLTDDDNGFVVFKTCSETYSDAVPTHYKLRCEGDVMTGKVVSYKDLFNLKGTRVKR